MSDIFSLSDSELTQKISKLAFDERAQVGALVRHLAVFDERRIHLQLGYSSLFNYCIEALRFSEAAAYRRIRAARIGRLFPDTFDLLENGELHVESISLLSPYLENNPDSEKLIESARGKKVREVEFLIAAMFPRQEIRDVIRMQALESSSSTLSAPSAEANAPSPSSGDVFSAPDNSRTPDDARTPTAAGGSEFPAPPPARETITPVSRARVRFAFTADTILLERLQRARELLRHKYPTGRMEDLILEALETLLDSRDPNRRPPSRRPENAGEEKATRRVPQWVKDEVWKRDEGRCAYVAEEGRRCGERGGLEYDHVVPWALGGPSNDPRNIRLLCRSHNQHAARAIFGNG